MLLHAGLDELLCGSDVYLLCNFALSSIHCAHVSAHIVVVAACGCVVSAVARAVLEVL